MCTVIKLKKDRLIFCFCGTAVSLTSTPSSICLTGGCNAGITKTIRLILSKSLLSAVGDNSY